MTLIKTLAVTGVLLLAAGLGSPLVASAQSSGQGQTVGLLFLLGASRGGAQANAKAPGQKPKPVASTEAQARKPAPVTAKDRTQLAKVGGATVEPTVASIGKHN
jgi:hypothetical protein